MDTEGPISVLDRRPRSSSRDRIIADRITRQRSPGPSFRHQRGRGAVSQVENVNDDSQEEVIYRIPQPYRTSFSAKHSVTWGKVDRSRSLSPTSSLRSDLSYSSIPPTLKSAGNKRRPRGQSKSPKRVTYNTRVTVRHSDTEDSVFTELSSYEFEDDEVPFQSNISPFSRALISPKYNEFSQLSPFPNTMRTGQQSQLPSHHVKDITNLSYSSAADHSYMSRDSGLDYSAELRDLSHQIAKMDWSPKDARSVQTQPRMTSSPTDQYYNHRVPQPSAHSPPGILKSSYDSYGNNRYHQDVIVSSGYDSASDGFGIDHKAESSRPGQLWTSDRELDNQIQMHNQENRFVVHSPTANLEGKTRTSPEGQESPVMHNDHGLQKVDGGSTSPTDTSQGEGSPGRGSPVESGRLTPSKRSVSLSITSFLKRVSPHFRRKRSKDRNKKTSSAESSAQSLANTSDGDTDQDISAGENNKTKRPGRFSRNQVRQSFMKLVSGSNSRTKKKKKKSSPEPGHYTIEPQDPEKQTSSEEVDEISSGFVGKSNHDNGAANGKASVALCTGQTMKPPELNGVKEQPYNHSLYDHHDARFSTSAKESSSQPAFSTQMKNETLSSYSMSSPRNETLDSASDRMDFFTESDINAILCPQLDKSSGKLITARNGRYEPKGVTPVKTAPPSSLDVMPARTKRLLQTSMISSISGDESIGDCSLDVNLTASEPSLLSGASQSSASRQVVIPSSLVSSAEGRLPSQSSSTNHRKTSFSREEFFSRESNTPPRETTSNSSRSSPTSPVDPSHKPSYLKLSCAVSGYGKYSGYSTYKDVARRSPCSSHSSLRSNMSSPDTSMPSGQISGEDTAAVHKNAHRPLGWSKFENNHASRLTSPTVAVNGHAPSYPTGDTKKDGEYFLQHMQFEDERIKGLCVRTEVYLRSHDLPEEASGRIRAATGKANLLVSQKFVQFRDLCHNHMQRSPDERETKWEDLQGFWDIVRIQIDSVDDMFSEIELMKQNGWQEVPEMTSKYSSASSSPRSGNISQSSTPAVTPSHTPASRRKNSKQSRNKDTPESSPEETQKARLAVKARDEARKKLLSEKRAAMKQATATAGGSEQEVEIFLQ